MTDSKQTDSSQQTKAQCPICGDPAHDHLYNCPSITPIQFLKAVQNDSSVPIRDRMRALNKLLRLRNKGIYSDDLGEVTTVVIPEVRWPQ